MVEVVEDGEEEAFFRVWLRLDDALGVIEPFDLVFIEPALRVIGVELGGGVDKLTALVKWGVRGVVGQIEEEGLIRFFIFFDDADGFVSNQVGDMYAVFIALNDLAIAVPCHLEFG